MGTHKFGRKLFQQEGCPDGHHVPAAGAPPVLVLDQHMYFAVTIAVQAQQQHACQVLDGLLAPEHVETVPQVTLMLAKRLTCALWVVLKCISPEHVLRNEVTQQHALDSTDLRWCFGRHARVA